MKRKTTWREKLDNDHGLPVVQPITGKLAERWPGGSMAIPSPHEVDDLMRSVPEGKLITINEMREAIARKHGASMTCPMTTGIFAWIAAHASDEARTAGEEDVTPYWRTLKTGGLLNPKYPGGAEHQKARLEAEGHTVVPKGQNLVVKDFESRLATLP